MKKDTMVGKRFTRWLVVGRSTVRKHNKLIYNCCCDCGKKAIVFGTELRRKRSRSCGCLQKDIARKLKIKHGKAGTSIYNIWCKMIARCSDERVYNYIDYGGRGITVCKRWSKFENFYKDMGDRPAGKSIDRRDNDGNYSKRNCRWATSKQQANNRRPRRWQKAPSNYYNYHVTTIYNK